MTAREAKPASGGTSRSSSTPPTLYLIDGFAQLFRAYHAIRTALASPVTREPTNATFGWVGMLLKVLREYKPEYLAIAIDVSGDRETFRSEIYPEYKANREPPPEDFRPQVGRSLDLARLMNIPVVGVEGFEADDCIATIVERLTREHPELRIRIVSKDKDLEQLLSDRVHMIDVHKDELVTPESLKANKGITPAQVVDMLALMGDTVDNVPGVVGIGPKTAAELIGKYGSIDEVYAHLDEIKGKRRENLEAAREVVPLSRTLVTLRRDVKLEFELEEARVDVGRLPVAELVDLFRQLGFNRYQDELKAIAGGGGEGASSEATSRSIEKEESVRAAMAGAVAKRERKSAEKVEVGAGRGARVSSSKDAGGMDSPHGLFAETERSSRESASSEGSGGGGRFHHEPARGKYECIRTKARLKELVSELKKAEIISIDTETTGIDPTRAALVGVCLSIAEGMGVYVPVRSPEPGKHLDCATVVGMLRGVLEDATRPKCGHNIKYDMIVLRRAGIDLAGVTCDTMVASFLVDSSRPSHSMDALAEALLNYRTIHIDELIGKRGRGMTQLTFDQVPLDDATQYAAEDADVTLRLRNVLEPQLKAMGLRALFDDVEVPLVTVLADMELAGIRVDPVILDEQREALAKRIEELREQIVEAAGREFNVDSPKQLAGVLFNKADGDPPGLGIKVVKRTQTGPSTDIEVLEKLAGDPTVATPVPKLIVEYRQLTKLVGTYLVALKEAINPETGRIHASFHQTVAATGRLSSSDPNLQNIPIRTDVGRQIRRAFVAEAGCKLITADYSQIELRMLAHLSEDAGLIEAFRKEEDIHVTVAAEVFGVPREKVTREQRDSAKMVNFGIIYGITPMGLARRLGETEAAAGRIIGDYKARFPGIDRFMERCVQEAITKGYVQTMLGRRRPVPQVLSRNPQERSLGERIAINSVVQGSAADLIKLAMIDLHRRLPAEAAGARMLLQIHDELVFEVPEKKVATAMPMIVARMEGAMALRVPLKVSAAAGENWMEGK